MVRVWAALLLLALALPLGAQTDDRARLARSLEYFRGGQYHECLLLLAPLDSAYALNPRYRAFLGVCCYHEGDYARAAACLDDALPALGAFAPQERALYCWAGGESHFLLGQYAAALPLYDAMLALCLPAGRGDAHYRLGFCHMYAGDWPAALESLESALCYYERFAPREREARVAQLRHMIAGVRAEAAGIKN